MEIKQMQYFKAVCECRSFSRASEQMFVSQQGLSKSILALERELGCLLFVRSSKGLILTEAGEHFYKKISGFLAEYRGIAKEMEQFKEVSSLQVAMVIGAGFVLPKELFDEFSRRHPEIQLKISEKENHQCMKALREGMADAAIIVSGKKDETFRHLPIKNEVVTLLVPKDHRLAEKEKIKLSDLQGETMVLYAGDSGDYFLSHCEKFGVRFRQVTRVPDIMFVYKVCMEENALGISLDSLKGMIRYPELKEIPLDESEIVWDIALVCPKGNSKKSPVNIFWRYWEEIT